MSGCTTVKSQVSELYSVKDLSQMILDIPDFPKTGIVFKDITPILENNNAFKSLTQHLVELIDPRTTKLMAPESRGFLLAAAITQHTNLGLVLARKPGKLPRETYSQEYDLEYGTDCLQIHKETLTDQDRVTIIDDVLATGGTAQALEALCHQAHTSILGHCFLMEIEFLKGREKLKSPVSCLLKV